MKKNMLFLSAALTTFMLAILAGVFYKARANAILPLTSTGDPVEALTQPAVQTLQPAEPSGMVPTLDAFISPQEAVFIASSALGNTQVYSVDTETRYGLDVYKVTFSSGSIVFVSPQGHILTITALQPAVVAQVSGQQSVGSESSPNNASIQPNPAQNPGDDDEHPGGDD